MALLIPNFIILGHVSLESNKGACLILLICSASFSQHSFLHLGVQYCLIVLGPFRVAIRGDNEKRSNAKNEYDLRIQETPLHQASACNMDESSVGFEISTLSDWPLLTLLTLLTTATADTANTTDTADTADTTISCWLYFLPSPWTTYRWRPIMGPRTEIKAIKDNRRRRT